MKFAGKCPPERDEIERLSRAGFDRFEVYLNTEILDDRSVDEIVETCREGPLEPATVHTPHVDLDEDDTEYYRKTDEIATELGSTLVMDSNPVSTRYMPDVYPSEAVSAPRHGYENDPGMSSFYLRRTHLDAYGENLVLDTAHLHMSESEYHGFVREIIAEYGEESVPVVHVDTGTATNDASVPLDEGGVDVREVLGILSSNDYGGVVVLEVSGDDQPQALEYAQSIVASDD